MSLLCYGVYVGKLLGHLINIVIFMDANWEKYSFNLFDLSILQFQSIPRIEYFRE